MKKLIICFILIIVSITIRAQNFSSNELINISKMNIDQIDTYVTQKKYQFDKSKNNGFAETITYNYEYNSYNSKATNWLNYHYNYPSHHRLVTSVSFQTLSSKDYLQIKNQLNIIGFKFIEKTTLDDGAIMLDYKKGKFELTLISGIINPNSENFATYEITVGYLK